MASSQGRTVKRDLHAAAPNCITTRNAARGSGNGEFDSGISFAMRF